MQFDDAVRLLIATFKCELNHLGILIIFSDFLVLADLVALTKTAKIANKYRALLMRQNWCCNSPSCAARRALFPKSGRLVEHGEETVGSTAHSCEERKHTE